MSFTVTILGSSSALPTSDRNLTAHVLNVDERFFLIDCGEGTQLQLRKYKAKLSRLDHIFITHLHGDHTFGLPGLIASLNLLGRKHDLHIYAHPDLQKLLGQFMSYYFTNLDFPILYHPLNYKSSEIIYEDKKITVESFPLKHRVPTCGFVFREKKPLQNIRKEMIEFYKIPIRDIQSIKNGDNFISEEGKTITNNILTTDPPPQKSYAFCSDTCYFENIIPAVKNVTLMYHEATFADEDAERAAETFHSTASDAAKIAKLSNAEKLIIGHFSARYKDVSPLVEQAKKIFPNTQAVEDGMSIII